MMIRRKAIRLSGSAAIAVSLTLAPSSLGFSIALTFAANAVGDGSLSPLESQTSQKLSIPPDSPRWNLEGQAKAVEYQGRKCLFLDGGAATLKDFEIRDGVIDVDVATPATRGFFGIQFRIANDVNGEWVYLREHKSGLPDAMQYTPVLNTGLNWQIYNGPGFTGAVDIPKDVWFRLRLEIAGAQAKFYVKDMDKPALVMNDLKSGIQRGQVALAVLTGATYFSNFEIRTTPDAAWERHLPPMPAGTLTKWNISPSYDALQRNLGVRSRHRKARTSNGRRWRRSRLVSWSFTAIARLRIRGSRFKATFPSAWSLSRESKCYMREPASIPTATR